MKKILSTLLLLMLLFPCAIALAAGEESTEPPETPEEITGTEEPAQESMESVAFLLIRSILIKGWIRAMRKGMFLQ